MKFKHLFVFTVVFALVALVTSCNKPSENKILGKWRTEGYQMRTSANPDVWVTVTPAADDVNIIEFRSNGTCYHYDEDGLEDTSTWAYDKDNEKLIIDGKTFDIVSFSSKEMVLDYKITEGDNWTETKTTLKKIS